MSHGAQLFREQTPYTYKRMAEESKAKRTRYVVQPPSEDVKKLKGYTRWQMTSVNIVSTDDIVSGNEDVITLNFIMPVDRDALTKSLEYFASLAGNALPLFECLTSFVVASSSSSSSSSSLTTKKVLISSMKMSRDYYSMMQALGFACRFEMSSANVLRLETFKTAPLFPVFIRMLFTSSSSMTTMTNSSADKWNVYAVARVLTSWLSRRLFDKALNVHVMMHNTDADYFTEHYRRLPQVLNIMYEHAQSKSVNLLQFVDENLIGLTILYTFFAPQQLTRLHHRLISEARYICDHLPEELQSEHAEFFSIIRRLIDWTRYDEMLDQNLIFIRKHDEQWTIDVRLLHALTYKIACDRRVPTDVAMSLMLSLVPSSRDDGKLVGYLEKILTPYHLIKRKDDIVRMMCRSRPREEHRAIAAKVYADLIFTNTYDKEIFDSVATFRSRKQSVVKWKGKLGEHALFTDEQYENAMLNVSTLYSEERLFHVDVAMTPLIIFLQSIDDYYNSYEDEQLPDYDNLEEYCSSKHLLLPLSAQGNYLDRVFFHL